MRINDRIRVAQVRVIDDAGEQLGVMETRDAIRAAREQGLDLVEVAPNADPPVCRIIDYGKYQYEAKKKAHDAKKKQVIITVKEVKFRPGTDDHDYDFKAKNAKRWLQDGDKVKATIFFRGREMAHRELGAELLQRLEKDLAEVGEVETRPRMEGNQMFFIFTPKRAKTSTAAKQAAALSQAASTTPPVPTAPPVAPASSEPPTNDEQG
ncbi:MAG: translation initiation factor IF-3 [Pyrinomonadaceae bacterium MAG19_C2-C3]|nr:translation initiation factor IF-3 [Pyrinomonadaceae bacterium MAG19_C2-C3]